MYDLIVIGAGPGGYEAAAHAGRMGKKVALIERAALGGTCLHAGCIPTKTLLRSAQVFRECRDAAAYGVRVPAGVEFDLGAVVRRKNRIVATLGRGVEGLLKRSRVEVIQGHAELVSSDTVAVGAIQYQARNILISTGSRPAVPPIPGIESALDSTALLSLTEIPKSLAVIGGGYIGLEFASFFSTIGTRVTVIEMLPRIAAGLDHDIAQRLQQSLGKAGVNLMTSTKVTAIDGNTVHCEKATVVADCILNATGRAPVLDGLGLERAGVDFDRKGIKTSDRGRTSVPGIWACAPCTHSGRAGSASDASAAGISPGSWRMRICVLRRSGRDICSITNPAAWFSIWGRQASKRSTRIFSVRRSRTGTRSSLCGRISPAQSFGRSTFSSCRSG